jgi:hypothetical protein
VNCDGKRATRRSCRRGYRQREIEWIGGAHIHCESGATTGNVALCPSRNGTEEIHDTAERDGETQCH